MQLLDIITKDSTDRSVTIRIIDSTTGLPETAVEHNTNGIDLWYRREGEAKVSITEVALSALTDAHTDGGIEHIGNGSYRLDLPDAAFATGANHVDIGGTVTDMIVLGGRVRLVDCDLEDSVRLGLTALPNAAADAAGGLPVSDAGGLDLDTVASNVAAALADTNELQTDWTNGGRLDLLVDAIKAVTDNLPDSGALTTLLANVASILADTNELQTDWVNGGRLDLLVDAIKAKTDNAIQKGTSYRYTNDNSGTGYDDVTVDDVP